MANLKLKETRTLKVLLQIKNGFILNFTNRDLYHLFEKLDVTIDHYHSRSNSVATYSDKLDAPARKGAAVLNFFSCSGNELVGEAILQFIEYIKNEISLEKLKEEDFPETRLVDAQNIAHRLLGKPPVKIKNLPQTVFSYDTIDIILHEDIFRSVQELLNNEHYSNALENAYKVVIGKSKEITGYEKATDAFSDKNLIEIWGYKKEEAQKDNFLQGMKFLLMAIQRFRNEIAHPPLREIEKNLALHYIALASLAYKLMLSVDMHASNKQQSNK